MVSMGYETPDMTQGYPYSYMSNAQAIGLLDGVNMVASTDALRGEDAQVIYNAMFTDYARGAMLVNTTHGTSVETYPTLAESVWGLDRAAVGTWTGKDDEEATLTNCKAHTWVVIGADPTEADHILAYPIDDDTTDLYDSDEKNAYRPYSFKYEGDAESVKGYQVELWGEGSHGEATWEKGEDKFVYSEDWTIKAIKTVKGQSAYDYNASLADSKSDNGTIVLDDETSLDLDTVASNASNVTGVYFVDQYVGKTYHQSEKNTIGSDKKVEAALNVRDGAQYKLMDWDSDGDVDWVVVSTANYYKVETVNSKRATVVSMKTGTDFEKETKSDSETWKLDGITEIDGNKYSFKAEDLEEGDILEVTYTVAYDKGEKDAVATATISKVDPETKSLDKVSTKDGLTLTFDEEEIKVAQNVQKGDVMVPANPTTYREFNSEELGTDFNLWLNRNGFIVYSDYATETSNYAMVLDTADGADRAGNRNLAKVDLLTEDGVVLKDVELTTGARVQDTTGAALSATAGDAYNDRKFDEAQMVGNVFKYWTNEDGQITRMQAMLSADDVKEDTANKSSYSYTSKTDRLQDANGKYVASLEEADVIFAVKQVGSANDADKTFIRGKVTDKDGLYVDTNDVIAVKASDVPDINLTAGTDDTEAMQLDGRTTRTANWMQDNTSTYANTFAISANGNKAGTAAILGVDNFNKFGVTNTKLGLVTDVTYANSTDGRYIEMDVAVGNEVKTLTSTKKVDFDDIVKAYDAQNKADIGVGSESSKINNTLFNNNEFDKYLEDNAAYAEVTTDADGNLTKVVFLDADTTNANLLKGHYYTVSRNVVSENKTKSFTYVNNDNTDGYNYYATDSKLYSVDRMPVSNAAVLDDTAYYTIDAKPSINDIVNKNYNNTEMLITDGFDGTPDIEVSDKASMMVSAIDNRYDSDTYFVSDIAFNNSGDIVAMYNYTDDLGETVSANMVSVSTDKTDNKIQAGTDTMTVTLKNVGGQTASNSVTISSAYLKGDSKKTPVSGITVTSSPVTVNPTGTFTIQANRSVAAGTYVVDLTVNGTTTQTLEFTVTAAAAQTVNGVSVTEGIDTTTFNMKVTDDKGANISGFKTSDFTVYVGGKLLVDGQYVVNELPSGEYQVQVLASGVDITSSNVSVTVGGHTADLGQVATGATGIQAAAVSGDVKYLTSTSATSAITLTNITASNLKIALGDADAFDYATAEASAVTDTTTGVTVTIDAGTPQLQLSGIPSAVGKFSVTIGDDAGHTATVEVTVAKNTLDTFSIAADNSTDKVTITVADEATATALADELNALSDKTDLVKAGSSSADTDKSAEITLIEASSSTVVITLNDSHLNSGEKVQVIIPELTSFTTKTSSEETIS